MGDIGADRDGDAGAGAAGVDEYVGWGVGGAGGGAVADCV